MERYWWSRLIERLAVSFHHILLPTVEIFAVIEILIAMLVIISGSVYALYFFLWKVHCPHNPLSTRNYGVRLAKIDNRTPPKEMPRVAQQHKRDSHLGKRQKLLLARHH